MKRVYIASPYRTHVQRDTYDRYLKMCIQDSISRNEAPYAPHFIYPLFMGVCEINDEKCRDMANKFLIVCDKLAVYVDFGISEGMQAEIDLAKAQKKPIEIRRIQ